MSLFNRAQNQEVPTIQVQGEEATIPQTAEAPASDAPSPNTQTETRVRLPKKTWGRS